MHRAFPAASFRHAPKLRAPKLPAARGMKKSSAARVLHIDRFMTRSPHVIGPTASLAEALCTMSKLEVRHLPVLEEGPYRSQLVGMLGERDGLMLEAIADIDPDRIPVKSAMQTDVSGVERDAPLDEVAATMASQKYGSAVVWSGSAVVGIFTTVDGMRTLTELARMWNK